MDKIFISIASYRDSELIKTVKSLVENADRSDLLRIVVFEQNGNDDESVEGIYPEWQVKVIKTHFSNAMGPVWARYIIQQEYANEEYYMQIDSHTRTVKNWDYKLKYMFELLPELSILTNYLSEYNINDESYSMDKVRSGLYVQGFGPNDGFTRIQSHYSKETRHFPFTCRAWSACFSFSKGSIVKDAPYDPNLKFIFFGEELDITLRLYTRGYYFFTPYANVIFTTFDRTYRRTYWQDIPSKDRKELEEQSTRYLRSRIFNINDGIYSLGTTRTIEDYQEFADIESFELKKLKKCSRAFRKYTRKIILK